MEANSNTTPEQVLLENAGWISRFAARLTCDPSTADDVIQDTWLAVLQHSPKRGVPVGAWLSTVLRNAARQRARGEGRRERREQEAARPEPEQDEQSQAMERFELRRELADIVAALDEPYRNTVILRYYEGLSAAEIARRDGVPAGTVRWRLSHALAQLRTQLDETHEDRRQWCLVLAPLIRPADMASSATPLPILTALQGALTVNVAIKLVVAVPVILGLITIGLQATALFHTLSGGEMPSNEPLLVQFRKVPVAAVDSPTVAGGERVTVATTTQETGVEDPLERTSTFTARFVDPRGNAVPNVRVTPNENSGTTMLTNSADGGLDSVLSGADGVLHARLAEGWSSDDRWSAELTYSSVGNTGGIIEAMAVFGKLLDYGDIVVYPAGSITGQVTGESGVPTPDVWVRTIDELPHPLSLAQRRRSESEHAPAQSRARTDEQGRFMLTGVPVGFARLVAGGPDWLATYSRPVEVRSGQESYGVELALEALDPEDVIEGIVVDPNGKPVPYADIRYEYRGLMGSGSGSRNVDKNGRFRLVLHHRAARNIRASSDGYRPILAEDVEPGTRDLVLQLGERTYSSMIVRGEGGALLEDFSATLFDSNHRNVLARAERGTEESTHWRVSIPEEAFTLEVDAEGYELLETGSYDGQSAPDRFELQLLALPGVQGRVIVDGRPLQGATISALRATDGRASHNGLPVRWGPGPNASAVSDAEGSFSVTVRSAGSYIIQAHAEGLAVAEAGPFDIEPRQGRVGIELNLTAGGQIEGYVLAGSGRSVAGTIVAANRGDGRARTVRVAADGYYRFESLTPGPWQIVKHSEEISPKRSSSTLEPGARAAVPPTCQVVEGQSTRFDLDLGGGSATIAVQGRVSVNGLAPGAWRAQLVPQDEFSRLDGTFSEARINGMSVTLDPSGAYQLRAPQPGNWRLTLTSSSILGLPLILTRDLALEAAGARLDLELSVGSVNLRGIKPLVDEAGVRTSTLDLLCWSNNEWTAMVALVAFDGRAQIPVMPAGEVRVHRIPTAVLDAGMPELDDHEIVAQGMLSAGRQLELTIQ